MNIALLDDNNRVVNIVVCMSLIEAEQLFQCACVEATSENDADIGAIFDAANGVFVRPSEPQE